MNTKNTAILTALLTIISATAFAFCVASGFTPAPRISKNKAPARLQIITFSEAEVPTYLVHRTSTIKKVTFLEREVPTIVVKRKSRNATLASKYFPPNM